MYKAAFAEKKRKKETKYVVSRKCNVGRKPAGHKGPIRQVSTSRPAGHKGPIRQVSTSRPAGHNGPIRQVSTSM
jgi:hypothetical protein